MPRKEESPKKMFIKYVLLNGDKCYFAKQNSKTFLNSNLKGVLKCYQEEFYFQYLIGIVNKSLNMTY